MAHDESNRTDRRTFLQAARWPRPPLWARPRPECPGCRGEAVDAADAAAGQDRRRRHDPGPGDREGPRRRPAPAARLRPRGPVLRHVGDLPLRARLQEVVRTGLRRPQADLPRHQGHAQDADQLIRMLDSAWRRSGPITSTCSSSTGSATSTPSTTPSPVKSKELKETTEAIQKSGKAEVHRLLDPPQGPRPDHPGRGRGGIVDAIMLQYTPWLDKDSPLNKALDACHKKGIGLISMKQIAGQFSGDKPKVRHPRGVVRRVPMLAERKLTPYPGPACTRSGPTSGSARSASR